ncbi:hypothetical protein ACOME3_003994 [Neoechinorhynchus agilis]
MSFCRSENFIKEGDVVVISTHCHKRQFVTISANGSTNTQFGMLKHSDIIGRQYNRRYALGTGNLVVMQGDSLRFTDLVDHRTQTLYHGQISQILTELDLEPGKVVVEADRCDRAIRDFKQHKVSDFVTAICRDVIEDGFRLDGMPDYVDAVFLDMPRPADAID